MALPSLSALLPLSPLPADASQTNSRPTHQRRHRNTVHWDRPDFDLFFKENAAHHSPENRPLVRTIGSLRACKPSPDILDLGDRKLRGQQQRRPPLAAETFVAPEQPVWHVDSDVDILDLAGHHDLVKAARRLDLEAHVFEKHRRQQFQWVLSLAAPTDFDCNQILDTRLDRGTHRTSGEGKRQYFGCNLLTWTKPCGKEDELPGGPEDNYLLLATPIDLKPDPNTTSNLDFTTHQFHIFQQDTESLEMASAQVMSSPSNAAGSPYRPSPLSAESTAWSTAAEASGDNDNTLTVDPRSLTIRAPLSTIEDSIVEIDQFEDKMETIAAATRLALPNATKDKPAHSPEESSKNASPHPRCGDRAQSPARIKLTSELARRDSVRNSPASAKAAQEVGKTPTKAAATPRKVARPASLAPPKPLQKTNRAPTVPTFELPGERVARELKEKKAARLSMQVDPKMVAEPKSLQRTRSVRSSKPATVPDFELPGEKYSRMKQEQLARKREQEEKELRERREFKARPAPTSRASTVRSTFTSRQRQTNMGQSEQSGQASPFSPSAESPSRSGAAKRQSLTMTPSMARTLSVASASTVSAAARGRTSSVGSSQFSSTRATSSSAGSVGSAGKRNSVSHEEIQQQKARAREIYLRDNSLGQHRELEKKEREQSIRLARQQYAELSRRRAVEGREKGV